MNMQNVPAYKGPELFIRWDCREPDVRFKFGMPGSDTPFPYTIQYYIVGYIRPWSEYEIRCLPPPFTPVLVYRTYDGREVHGVYLTEVGELGSMPLHLVSRDIPYLGAPFGGSPFGEDPFSSYSTLARDPNVYDSSNSSLNVAAAWLHYNNFRTHHGAGSTKYTEYMANRYKGFYFEDAYRIFDEELGRPPQVEAWWNQQTVKVLQVIS